MLHYLHRAIEQPCPSCHQLTRVTMVIADTDREAATSKVAVCPACFGLPSRDHRFCRHLSLLDPWWGVDFDGTLATKVQDIMTTGEPIFTMIERVQQMRAEGKLVKIFTARVAHTGAYSAWSDQF